MIAHQRRYERREGVGKQIQKAGCGLMAMGCLICLLVPFLAVLGIIAVGLM